MIRHVGIQLLLATALYAVPSTAQSQPTDFRDEFLRHFEQSSNKVLSLSTTVPQELYDWSPGEGVMTIAQVYMHIARYNFMYLEDQLDIAAPHDVDVANLESLTNKEIVTSVLRRSIEHVRESITQLPEAKLTTKTRLYGRDVPGWAVLFQLLAHMNEHVGQSVAYVRMNGITPPWST